MFGDSTPISSTKSFFGHTLGASGVLELIASLLLVGDGVVPHGLRMDAVREGCARLDYVRGVPRTGRPDVIMVNNFGFGGNNSSLVVRAGQGRVSRRPQVRRPDAVMVTGFGIVSAAGDGAGPFRHALEAGDPLARRDPDSGIDAAYCPRVRVRERGVRPIACLAGWAHFQDPVDLSVARDGNGLRRAIDAALRMAGITPADVGLVSLLDRGVAPARHACRQALSSVFGPGAPRIVRPDEVFGFAPSCGAAMTVAAALAILQSTGQRLRHVLAAGCDLIGDGFAFILERNVQ